MSKAEDDSNAALGRHHFGSGEDDRRKRLLAKIHIAKKELGLGDDTYRDVLEKVTGKRSASGCTDRELGAVMDHFKSLGFVPRAGWNKSSAGPAAEKYYLPKMRALWISGYWLGVVRNKDDAAMLAFLKRQTGLDHERFLKSSSDAAKAIEALKSWLARDGGVDWSVGKNPRICVVWALWRALAGEGFASPFAGDGAGTIGGLIDYGRESGRRNQLSQYDDASLDALIVTLGEELRILRAAASGGDR
jgi:hypothetical protein